MMRQTSGSDGGRASKTAVVVVTVTLGLLAAGCAGSTAATGTIPTAVADSTADTTQTDSTEMTSGADELAGLQGVDGRKLFLQCRGSGSPTVILQSGFGNAGDIWSVTDTSAPAVFPALAESNRVCVYDRPGSMITTTDSGGTVRPPGPQAVPAPR